jgi:zinc transport system permease protein
MIDFLFAPFSFDFMQRALLGGVMIAIVCALVGVLIVQRGLSFTGDGLAHATFGGIGLNIFWGVSSEWAVWASLPFTIAVAVAVSAVRRRGKLRGDTAIAVFLPLTLAMGVVFLGLRPVTAPPVDLEGLLFGSVLAINSVDLIVIGVVAATSLIVLALAGRQIAYAGFDEELAAISGVNAALVDYVLISLAAVIVVVAVKAVGVTMVSSFLVIPPVASLLVGKRLGQVLLLAVSMAVVGASVGLMLSFHLNLSGGATVVLTLGALFGLVFLLQFSRGR